MKKKNVELYIDCRKEKMSNFLPSVKCFAMCLIKRYLRKTQGKIDFFSKTIKPTYLLTYLLIRAVKRFCYCIILESKSEKKQKFAFEIFHHVYYNKEKIYFSFRT